MVPSGAPGEAAAVKRDLIYFSPIPWRGLYQRPQHTASFLAQRRRVLFVEPRTLHAPAPPPDQETLSFLALPVIPSNARQPFLRRAARAAAALSPLRALVEARQGARLRRKADALGLSSPLLLYAHPEFFALRRLFPGAPLAYDHMDDILGFGDPPPALRENLERLMGEAAWVNATSLSLGEQARRLGARRLLAIGNGVEWDRFANAAAGPEPAELAGLPRPRILYAGSVAEWLDLDLLFAVARRLPAMAFPVIGPVRPGLAKALRAAPGNVRFFGAKPYAEVPAWLAHSQAALIPFRISPLTAAVDPVKIYEYLAAGLPVLATPFSPEIRALAPAVLLADDAEGFAAGLVRVLAAPPDPAGQRAAAAPRRWDRLLSELDSALDSL